MAKSNESISLMIFALALPFIVLVVVLLACRLLGG